MELRHYYTILRRSWPLALGLPLLVAILTLGSSVILPPRYGLRVAMLVTQKPIAVNDPKVTLPDYNNFNSWAASEYIVDDLLQLVKQRRFADDIAAWIKQQQNATVDAGTIQSGLSADRTNRMIYLSVQADRQDVATWIAQGAVAMLQQKGLEYWGRADSAQLNVVVQDLPASAGPIGGRRAIVVDAVVRTLLAFILAAGLAFLRHYLDQTLRRRDDVEALGLDVVGAIPLVKGAKG